MTKWIKTEYKRKSFHAGSDATVLMHATLSPATVALGLEFAWGPNDVANFNKTFPQISHKMNVNGRRALSGSGVNVEVSALMVGGEVGGAHNAPPGRFVIPDSLAVTSVRIATITRKKRSRNLANAK
ncbi:unnamed protein product [Euphydryas editha]|uniref:Uncharacterized protein n=1 Tax=Euphydryas editha TaxID=104508 RepID=A0AAU9UXQ4_EUPED|nr:unnamed protein product [Euphydryas editha]